MGRYLGIDTSNYTTSTALYNSESGEMLQQKKLLQVKSGEKGLRQSDALFQHVKMLPSLMETLDFGGCGITAVGYSARPRDVEGSYMPCFLAGEEAARCIAAAISVPCFDFSHQEGHIAAALFSISKLEMLHQRFVAFHVSGGTTDVLLCSPENGKSKIEQLASSLDLKAGQVVDRVGIMLGLDFPAGPQLEALALQSEKQFSIKPCMKGCDCCLSGLENICADMLKAGEIPCDVARFCLEYIKSTLDNMAAAVLDKLGCKLPLLFAGGVMSNSIIRDFMTAKYDAYFAAPGFSSDNAAGIAALAKIRLEGI